MLQMFACNVFYLMIFFCLVELFLLYAFEGGPAVALKALHSSLLTDTKTMKEKKVI